MPIEKRESLNDLWRVDTSPLHKKVTFQEAFPEIESLTLEVAEISGFDYEPTGKSRIYTDRNFPGEYLDCGNRLCFHGGIHTGEIIREALKDKQTELIDRVSCYGYETSPKGQKVKRPCNKKFRITLKISYKEAAPTNQSSDSDKP